MGTVLFLAYMVAGYWAAGKVIYANKIVVYTGNALFVKKFVWGFVFGWVLIPIAVVKAILQSRE